MSPGSPKGANVRSGGSSGPAARVVTVSSLVHRGGRLRLDDLDSAQRYQKWEAYAQSKLANLLFAYELQRRFSTEKEIHQLLSAYAAA